MTLPDTSSSKDVTAAPPVNPGDVLAGRYRVERLLAAGGMGVVVAAKHVQLGHRVAIKFLLRETTHKDAAARFLSEAKASASLRGEHVARVSDVGTLDDGAPFMVMEFLDGKDLEDVLEAEGPLPVEIAVDYVLQACEGLAEAHAARIIHRDLKPGNLFRTRRPDGSDLVKVLDFGVSKAFSEDVRAAGTVTQSDAVFGSPLYMSPEQMKSATQVDVRSDVWSLGVVLYELVSGRLPFEADTIAGVCVAIATEPPKPLRMFAPKVPVELEAVIRKCIEKDPARRYQDVGDFAADLEPFIPNSRERIERIQRLVHGMTSPPRSVPSAPSLSSIVAVRNVPAEGAETLDPMAAAQLLRPDPPKPRRTWLVVAAVAAVLAVGGGFLGVQWMRAGSPGTSTAALVAPDKTEPPPAPPAASTGVASMAATDLPIAAPPSTVPTATAVAVRPPPVRPKASAAPKPPPPPTTASSGPSVLIGISHDRK